MNIDEADFFIDEYYKWLKNETELKPLSKLNMVAISTPFKGLFNDTISLLLKKTSNGQIIISDDGETINNLILAGLNIDKGATKTYIDRVINSYGLGLNPKYKEIHLTVEEKEFPQKKHLFISALIELNDIQIKEGKISTDFYKEVDEYLIKSFPETIYSPRPTLKGRSNIEYTYDFQSISRLEELYIKTFNKLNEPNIIPFLYSFINIKPVRESINRNTPVRALAVFNDQNNYDVKLLRSIENDGADYIAWSLKEDKSYKYKFLPKNQAA